MTQPPEEHKVHEVKAGPAQGGFYVDGVRYDTPEHAEKAGPAAAPAPDAVAQAAQALAAAALAKAEQTPAGA